MPRKVQAVELINDSSDPRASRICHLLDSSSSSGRIEENSKAGKKLIDDFHKFECERDRHYIQNVARELLCTGHQMDVLRCLTISLATLYTYGKEWADQPFSKMYLSRIQDIASWIVALSSSAEWPQIVGVDWNALQQALFDFRYEESPNALKIIKRFNRLITHTCPSFEMRPSTAKRLTPPATEPKNAQAATSNASPPNISSEGKRDMVSKEALQAKIDLVLCDFNRIRTKDIDLTLDSYNKKFPVQAILDAAQHLLKNGYPGVVIAALCHQIGEIGLRIPFGPNEGKGDPHDPWYWRLSSTTTTI